MSIFESLFYVIWRGLAIGILISAPMGPVGILCIQRTLDKGRKAGFYTGCGAALSDLFYCLLTGFGLSFIEEFLERNSNVIQIVGSIVLVAFAVYLLRKNPARSLRPPSDQAVSARKSILGGFLFTFSNPLIIFLIIGLFARFNFLLPDISFYHYIVGFMFIIGGALLWWWFVTFAVDKVRSHFNIRSMWLINRIIGIIIMLFALVGIITAVTAFAAPPPVALRHSCWNSTRGFEGFGADLPSASGVMTCDSASPLRVLTAATPSADFREFRFRLENRHCTPQRRYSYTDSDGHRASARMPAWEIMIKDTSGREVSFLFRGVESGYDGVSSHAALSVRGYVGDKDAGYSEISRNVDPTGRLNVYCLRMEGSECRLLAGSRGLQPLLTLTLPDGFMTDSIGWVLHPGSEVCVADVRLSESIDRRRLNQTPWRDSDLLDEYLEKSQDALEGYWQILDRTVDDSLMRPGGDYRLAMVRALDGYDLIYLSGGIVNSTSWYPGMIKAHLSPSGIGGVWDVEWYDAMLRPLSHEVKARMESGPLLTVMFPWQGAQLRIIRTR